MNKEELVQEIHEKDYYGNSLPFHKVLYKLVGETIYEGEVCSKFWKDKGCRESCYYVITNKRFLKFILSPDLFIHRFYLLRGFRGLEEIIEPICRVEEKEENNFELNGLPRTYTVKFFFDTGEEEIILKKIQTYHELEELKVFIEGLCDAVARL